MLENSWVAAQLAASQEGLSSMELLSYNNNQWHEDGRKSDFCIFQILVTNRLENWH
jgi:hypothetical protein